MLRSSPNRVYSALSLVDLSGIIASAWSKETSADPSRWSPTNPASGQCAVTALVVQDFLGGELLRALVGHVSHYWNLLPSGRELDLTIGQFGPMPPAANEIAHRARSYVLSFVETQRRYEILRDRVASIIGERAARLVRS